MNFNKKRVLIYGLGVSGKGVYEFLKNKNCELCAYDDNIDTLTNFCASYAVEKYSDRAKYDYIITAPTVRRDSEFLKKQIEKGTTVMSEIELAAKFCKAKIIGVTGTNGKTTVVSLIAHILNKSGIVAYKCGNIGITFVSIAEKATENDYIILELSSYQLMNTYDLHLDFAVLINIHQDHLDYHKNLTEYINAKLKILSFSENTIVNSDDEYIAENVRGKYVVSATNAVTSGIFVNNGMIYENNITDEQNIAISSRIANEAKFTQKPQILDDKIEEKCFKALPLFRTQDIGNMQGVFMQNCLLAICVVKLVGVQNIKILEAIECYAFEHYRLEKSQIIKGITFYNDSKSTNIHSTLGAVKSINGNYALILGGKDKGVPYDELINVLDSRAKYILICGENEKLIIDACIRASYYNYYRFDNLEEVAEYAIFLPNINTVIFSPSAASFDKYNGYDERGAHYDKIIKRLSEKQ